MDSHITSAQSPHSVFCCSCLILSLPARLVRTESVPCDINNPLRYTDLHISQTLPKTNKINKVGTTRRMNACSHVRAPTHTRAPHVLCFHIWALLSWYLLFWSVWNVHHLKSSQTDQHYWTNHRQLDYIKTNSFSHFKSSSSSIPQILFNSSNIVWDFRKYPYPILKFACRHNFITEVFCLETHTIAF